MSDPAVEAARRAWAKGPCNDIEFREHEDGLWSPNAMVTTAREVLAPLRNLHKLAPYALSNPNPAPFCLDCDQDWPCDTAKLIYSEDELQ
ncbi:hypothetical protein SEA_WILLIAMBOONE_96 [Gordonia phage WilliamBoone]|nr:hypothetical protein SEA_WILLIAMBOONE_96 [Gordonia phage WilliamBoone]